MSIRQHWHTPFARATSGEMTCYNATYYVATSVLCLMLATAARVYAEECGSFAVFGKLVRGVKSACARMRM